MQGARKGLASVVLGVAVSATLLVGARPAAAAVAPAAAAAAAPEVLASLGTSFSANGVPGGGGASAALGMLWPFEQRYAFGVTLFGDDLGTGMEELKDPNTGASLGTVGSSHSYAWGADWHTEARLQESKRTRLLLSVGFGYSQQVQDQFGNAVDAVSGVLASTGLTYLYKASHGHALGATLAYKHHFVHTENNSDRSTTWASAAFEWRWRGTPKE